MRLAENLLVGKPTETAEGEQAPLILAHSNVGKRPVDNLALACDYVRIPFFESSQ